MLTPMAIAPELMRALGDLALLPPRLLCQVLAQPARCRDLAALLPTEPTFADAPPDPARLPERPLRFFLSAAEDSGEIHAANLARALQSECAANDLPAPELFGFGGDRMQAVGVELLDRPVDRAAMGIGAALRDIRYFANLLNTAADTFKGRQPDAFCPVDSPALHVPLARIAAKHGTPTVHFVAPQYWAWAPWRTRGYAKAIDTALTILPFEPAWFDRTDIHTEHVGHPLQDALAEIPTTRPSPDATDLVLLPGSRGSVIDLNLPWMLERAAPLADSGAPITVLQASTRHSDRVHKHIQASSLADRATLQTGDLHTHLATARTALSVSGTVLLDLLHHRLPTIVVYRLESGLAWIRPRLLNTPYFSSTNLLAAREVIPEFGFSGDGPTAAVEAALQRAHTDSAWRANCIADLDEATRRLGPPGATRRAARAILRRAQSPAPPTQPNP
jgi:lipid-A-disaccharide synthase